MEPKFIYTLPKSSDQKFNEWIDEQVAILETHPGMWMEMPYWSARGNRLYTYTEYTRFARRRNIEIRDIDSVSYIRYVVPKRQTRWVSRQWKRFMQEDSGGRFAICLAVLMMTIIIVAIIAGLAMGLPW